MDDGRFNYLTELAHDWAAWASWYDDARHAVEAICDPRGWDSVRFACALSALSPRVAVRRNVGLMAALTRGEGPQGLKATWSKAAAIWREPDGHEVCDRMLAIADLLPPGSSYKTACFAAILTGNMEPVTLDSWMCKACGEPVKVMASRPWYIDTTNAVQTIAADIGLTPAGTQSAIWHAYALGEGGRVTMGQFAPLLLAENWGSL